MILILSCKYRIKEMKELRADKKEVLEIKDKGGQQRTLRVGDNRQNRRGTIRKSLVRLKVRNIDEK